MKSNKKVKVSVFVPCYNMGAYIDEAIQSIYAQTYKDYEIILVDDGSTDKDTLKQLKNIAKQHPDIRIFYKENSGLSGAKNYGIERANGEYIVCLDADDKLAPTYLEKTVRLMDRKKNDNVAVVTTWLQEFGLRNDVWRTRGYDPPRLLITNLIHAGSIFRKDVWEKVGGFKKVGASYEDWEFWINIAEKGYKWEVVEEVLFFYRIRENSLLASAETTHMEIYETIYNLHPQIYKKYAKDLIIENAREIKELRKIISEKSKIIDHQTELKEEAINEVISLRAQTFQLRDEINSLRNSRVLGKVIKLRDFIGAARKKIIISPGTIIHKIRVVVAPFIPASIRRFIKKTAKRILHKDVTIRYRANSKWQGGPLVSVVIPYYNRSDTIDETLTSLQSQTYLNFEIILVNDGSTDIQSLEKLKEIAKQYPKVKIINQQNAGVAAARNHGIKQSSGKYTVCLDSDDALEPTFIEKCTVLLETNPDVSLVTTHMESFGVIKEPYKHVQYDAEKLMRNNMVITAAQYKKEAWQKVGGYKSAIGYEDWEYWVNLAENGYWGKLIPEPLFRYRTAMESRYVGDKSVHWSNLRMIRDLHPKFRRVVKRLQSKRQFIKTLIEPDSAFTNLINSQHYRPTKNHKPNVLIAIPWMTFGGAETLILNFCNEVKDDVNLSFITGLESEHEWEHKFKQLSDQIYHLNNLFDQQELFLEFFSTYISTRKIDILHIIHTAYVFDFLPELKKRHPEVKVVVTMFNDRAAHFARSIKVKDCIDIFTSDNEAVYNHYREELGGNVDIRVIPNGINSTDTYNPVLYDRRDIRTELELADDDIAIFFIGRLAEEKNPGVFLDVAGKAVKRFSNLKFFVIGDGALRHEIEKHVSRINNNNVKYLGYKSDIARHLSGADIFILPSSIEGFPLSVLEAMAMGVAVIASDVGAVSEVIETGVDGLVVRPGARDDFEKAVIKLSKEKNLLKIIKGNARKKVDQKYSNKILGRNYRKLYRDAIS